MADATNKQGARPNVVLGMLLLVYIFNFVDRQILAILAAPIQADLDLSDTQMGLLGGIAFAILYSTLAVPLSTIADRTSRSWVITISLVIWSGFTAICGLAQGFWHIFLARLGVGIGEAGGVAPSYAVIGDYFPSAQRARALSIYSLGIPIGSAVGVMAGGYIAATVDWRLAFFVVGLAGLVIAVPFRLLVKDKPKPAPEPAGLGASGPSLKETAILLAGKKSFWLLTFGASASSMLGYGLGFWAPSLLMRSFGLDLVTTSYFIGALLLIGGVAGMLLGGVLADWLGNRDRIFYGLIPAVAFMIGIPLYAIGILGNDMWVTFFLWLVPQAMAYVWLGPVLTSIQHLVAPASRAMASSLFLLFNNLLGLGGGIYALGAVSDLLAPTYGDEALRYSMLYSLGLYAVAALLMALAGPSLRKDWVAES